MLADPNIYEFRSLLLNDLLVGLLSTLDEVRKVCLQFLKATNQHGSPTVSTILVAAHYILDRKCIDAILATP